MHALAVTIQRWVDDGFPGLVECRLIDAQGAEHRFIEKAPVLSPVSLTRGSVLPQPGRIACVIQETWTDAMGRKLVRVCTSTPWGIESVAGQAVFSVLDEQIS